MSESSSVMHAKYTTVNIPVKLFIRIEKLVEKNKDFKTVTDYVTFILREVVVAHATSDSDDCFNSADLEQLRIRLEALGAM